MNAYGYLLGWRRSGRQRRSAKNLGALAEVEMDAAQKLIRKANGICELAVSNDAEKWNEQVTHLRNVSAGCSCGDGLGIQLAHNKCALTTLGGTASVKEKLDIVDPLINWQGCKPSQGGVVEAAHRCNRCRWLGRPGHGLPRLVRER